MNLKNWSVWDIKSRWLRMAFTWPALTVTIIAVLVAGAVAIPFFALKGVWRGVYDALSLGEREWWADACRYAWAALSGKDEPA